MIARTVHNHLPENQLKLPYFSAFKISNNIPENVEIMNIDILPSYV